MEKINFESLPSTNTPINATNLNQLQTNVENAINGVVESGSNDNGSWIKFEDGTMKQWGAGVFSSGGTYDNDSWTTVTFPQRFIGDKNSYSYKPVYMSGTVDPINGCMEMNLTGSRSYGEGNAYVDRDVVYRRLSNAHPDGAEQLELFKIPSRFVWEAIGRWK